MKKIIGLFFGVLLMIGLENVSASVIREFDKATISENKNIVTINDVYEMKARKLKILFGHKISLQEKLAFIMLKKELKKEIKKGNGDKDISFVLHRMIKNAKEEFRLGGFLSNFLPVMSGTILGGSFLGLSLGLTGVGFPQAIKGKFPAFV